MITKLHAKMKNKTSKSIAYDQTICSPTIRIPYFSLSLFSHVYISSLSYLAFSIL